MLIMFCTISVSTVFLILKNAALVSRRDIFQKHLKKSHSKVLS